MIFAPHPTTFHPTRTMNASCRVLKPTLYDPLVYSCRLHRLFFPHWLSDARQFVFVRHYGTGSQCAVQDEGKRDGIPGSDILKITQPCAEIKRWTGNGNWNTKLVPSSCYMLLKRLMYMCGKFHCGGVNIIFQTLYLRFCIPELYLVDLYFHLLRWIDDEEWR